MELHSMIYNMPDDAGMQRAGHVSLPNVGLPWHLNDAAGIRAFLRNVPQGGVVSINTEADQSCILSTDRSDKENEQAFLNIARKLLLIQEARPDCIRDLNVMPPAGRPDPWRYAGSLDSDMHARLRKLVAGTHKYLVPLAHRFSFQCYFHRVWEDLDHCLFGQVRDFDVDKNGKIKTWPTGEPKVYRGKTDTQYIKSGGWVDSIRSGVNICMGYGLPIAIYFNPTYEYFSRPASLRGHWIQGEDQEQIINYLNSYGCPVYLWVPYIVPKNVVYYDGMPEPAWKDSVDEGPWQRWLKEIK